MAEAGNFDDGPRESSDDLNWVDPDIVAYYGEDHGFDKELEKEFRQFFVTEWQKPEYDHLRPTWDRYISSDDPHMRLYGKSALWSYVRLLKIRRSMQDGMESGQSEAS